MSRSSYGFTLIELLVVVVIIGIVAAIAIPTMINALDRGRQKRTMADLRSIGAAIQAYAVDVDRYPVASSAADLSATLDGDYIRRMPLDDGWGNRLLYSGISNDYTLGSVGKGGGASLNLISGGGPTNLFADDIIYSNGSFVQWPEGMQSQ